MTSGSMQVWDLHDETQGVTVFQDHDRDHEFAGPVAALLGAIAIGAAVSTGVPIVSRWVLVLVLGVAAVVVAFAALRRHQTVLTLGLTVIGLVAPIAAVLIVAGSPAHLPAVRNTALAAATDASSSTLVPTGAFRALPPVDRRIAGTFASGLVLRLRALHGDRGPFPDGLAISGGEVVEGTGDLRGTSLGPLPEGVRLTYSVSADRSAFRLVVTDTDHRAASVHADSALAVPGLD